MNQMNMNNPMMNPMNINNPMMNPMMNPMNINNPMMNPMNMNINNPMMNPMNNMSNPMMNQMGMNNPMMNQMNMNNPMMNSMNNMNNSMMNQMGMNNPMMNPMNNMNNPMMNQMNMNNPMMNQIGMNMKNPMNFNIINNPFNNLQNNFNMEEFLNNNNINFIKMGNESSKSVEELKINMHLNIYPKTTYKLKYLYESFSELGIKLYRCSRELHEKIKITDHPVLTAYYTAFLEHYPFVLTPDILWMLILQGFSHHVRNNAKKLKNKFVKKSTEKIVITQRANGDKNINKVSSGRWGDIFSDFVEQSKEYIDGTVLHLFTPYFSTTTEEIEYACKLNTISIVSPYIKFVKKFERRMKGACGFPYIKLQGTLQDYKQLKIKVQGLKGYSIDDWIEKLLPIIDKIIETKKGNIDRKFWDNMITNQEREYTVFLSKGVSDAHPIRQTCKEIKIFGWIFEFFPFKVSVELYPRSKEDPLYNEQPYATKEKLIRNDIKKYYDPNFNDLPEEMINIDSTYRDISGNTAELGIKTGFLGYSIDKDHAFKPEIGWYFYIKNDPFNLIKHI